MEAGTVADWVAAIGTLLAIAWALFLYRRSIRDHREAAARRVYPLHQDFGSVQPDKPAEFGPEVHDIFVHDDVKRAGYLVQSPVPSNSMRSTIVPEEAVLTYVGSVVNGSDEPIATVNFEITTLGGRKLKGFHGTIRIVHPGDTKSVALMIPHFKDEDGHLFTMLGLTVGIRFSDSSGRRWRRVAGSPVEAVQNEWFDGRHPRSLRRDLKRSRRNVLARMKRAARYLWPKKHKRK